MVVLNEYVDEHIVQLTITFQIENNFLKILKIKLLDKGFCSKYQILF